MLGYRIIIATILGLALSPVARAQSIHDLRPPSGVPGTSPTAGNDALVLGMLTLDDMQSSLHPIYRGAVHGGSTEEEIADALALVQSYVDETVDVIVIGALLVNSTSEPPVPLESLVAFMQEQVLYIHELTNHLEFDVETLNQQIVLDVRFEDIEADVQVALVGRYVQILLLRTDRTATETSVLETVETVPFMEALSEVSGVSIGITDTRSLDWDSLVGETILVRYLDERLRLVERTVAVTDYDFRFGVILPPLEEGKANVHVKISRIEFVQFPGDSSGN